MANFRNENCDSANLQEFPELNGFRLGAIHDDDIGCEQYGGEEGVMSPVLSPIDKKTSKYGMEVYIRSISIIMILLVPIIHDLLSLRYL